MKIFALLLASVLPVSLTHASAGRAPTETLKALDTKHTQFVLRYDLEYQIEVPLMRPRLYSLLGSPWKIPANFIAGQGDAACQVGATLFSPQTYPAGTVFEVAAVTENLKKSDPNGWGWGRRSPPDSTYEISLRPVASDQPLIAVRCHRPKTDRGISLAIGEQILSKFLTVVP